MLDHEKLLMPKAIDELTPELKKFLNRPDTNLKAVNAENLWPTLLCF